MAAKRVVKFSGLVSAGVLPPVIDKPVPTAANAQAFPNEPSAPPEALVPHSAAAPVPLSVEGQTVTNQGTVEYRAPSSEQPRSDVSEIQIPIGLIDANPFAPREVYKTELLASRAADLATNGQIDAIHVIPHPVDPGRFMIADGWTRVLACVRYESLKTLRARVHYDLTPKQASWLGFRANHERAASCDFDDASYFSKLIADGDSQTSIAERFNISSGRISMLMAFFKLPDELLSLVRDYPEKFTYRVCHELYTLHKAVGTKKSLDVALRFFEENQTFRWLVAQVQSQVSPSKKSSKRSSVKVIRAENGIFRQNQGKFELSLQVPSDKEAEFASRIEALISGYLVNGQPLSDGEAADLKTDTQGTVDSKAT
jgi:ParB family chromosome partitioning protein